MRERDASLQALHIPMDFYIVEVNVEPGFIATK